MKEFVQKKRKKMLNQKSPVLEIKLRQIERKLALETKRFRGKLIGKEIESYVAGVESLRREFEGVQKTLRSATKVSFCVAEGMARVRRKIAYAIFHLSKVRKTHLRY